MLRFLFALLLILALAGLIFAFVLWQEERRSAFGPGSLPLKSHVD